MQDVVDGIIGDGLLEMVCDGRGWCLVLAGVGCDKYSKRGLGSDGVCDCLTVDRLGVGVTVITNCEVVPSVLSVETAVAYG